MMEQAEAVCAVLSRIAGSKYGALFALASSDAAEDPDGEIALVYAETELVHPGMEAALKELETVLSDGCGDAKELTYEEETNRAGEQNLLQPAGQPEQNPLQLTSLPKRSPAKDHVDHLRQIGRYADHHIRSTRENTVFYIEVTKSGRRFPLKLSVTCADAHPALSALTLPDGTEFPCLPDEQTAAQLLFTILEKLELINDLDAYYRLHRLLKKKNLSGTKVCARLRILCKSAAVTPDEARLKRWQTYHSYSYMKKKWKRTLRRFDTKEPAWEEAFDTIDAFAAPVWEALCENSLTDGDWLAEMGRFF